MALGLNTNKDSFIFNFPSDFIPKELEDRYKIILEMYHLPYMSIIDYINSTILDVNMPSVSQNVVTQKKMYGKERNFRSSVSPYDLYNKEITISLQDVDYGIPATIIHDAFQFHYIKNGKPFVKPLIITRVDEERRELFKYVFCEIIPISISDFRLGYQELDDSPQTYTLTCKFNFLDIEFVPRYSENSSSGDLIDPYFDKLIKNDPTNNIDQNGEPINGIIRTYIDDANDEGFIGK